MDEALDNLIERVEAAKAGSRELDAAIWFSSANATGPIKLNKEVYGESFVRECWTAGTIGLWDDELLHYTTSVDAALTLVPEGWTWNLGSDSEAYLMKPGHGFLSDKGDTEIYGRAATPALAIISAALKARKADNG